MPAAADKPSRKALVAAYLQRHQPPEIDRPTLRALRQHVVAALGEVAISDRYLLDLAEQCGIPVARELGGLPLDLLGRIHVHDLAAAEACLRDLHREYQAAQAARDPRRADDCRRAVLRRRRRLELLLRRVAPDKRPEKAEILSWFRVWLETPDLFPTWLELRKKRDPSTG